MALPIAPGGRRTQSTSAEMRTHRELAVLELCPSGVERRQATAPFLILVAPMVFCAGAEMASCATTGEVESEARGDRDDADMREILSTIYPPLGHEGIYFKSPRLIS